MNKSVALLYIFWSLMLAIAGISIYNKMTNIKDPNSLMSNFKKLEETINENP